MGGGREARVRAGRDCSCLSALSVFSYLHVVERERTNGKHCHVAPVCSFLLTGSTNKYGALNTARRAVHTGTGMPLIITTRSRNSEIQLGHRQRSKRETQAGIR